MPSFENIRFLLSIFRLLCSVRSFAKTYICYEEAGPLVLRPVLEDFHSLTMSGENLHDIQYMQDRQQLRTELLEE